MNNFVHCMCTQAGLELAILWRKAACTTHQAKSPMIEEKHIPLQDFRSGQKYGSTEFRRKKVLHCQMLVSISKFNQGRYSQI
jgi:hypothetical protein